jgi:hypothetical protein
MSGMLATMKRRPPPRVAVGPVGLVGVMLAGTWLGHTFEYLRVWGVRGASSSVAASVHAYMGPTGALLVLAGLLGVLSTARLARRLEARLGELRSGRRTIPSVRPADAAGGPTWSLSVPALLGTVWAGQCGLYVLQENLEAAVAHRSLPGLAVLAGVHALAPVVHLAVASALVAGLWLVRRQVTWLADAVRLAAARVRRAARAVSAPCPSRRMWTPLERWGTHLWCRPPPAFVLG